MSSRLNIQDNQELPASDLMKMQDYRREQVDNLVKDAIDDTKKFAGFAITSPSASSITVGDGRIYVAGLDYSRPADTSATFNLLSGSVALPVAAQKIISLVAWGTEVNTAIQPREFETAVTDTNGAYTGEYTVESRDVPTEKMRFANVALLEGVESANPQPPVIGSQYVEIARLLCSNAGIVSISYVEANRLESVKDLDLRTTSIEQTLQSTVAAIGSIIGDIGAITRKLESVPTESLLRMMLRDLARLKEKVNTPDTATAYGSITFATANEMDLTHAQSLCRLDGTLTFPDAAIKEAALTFANPNEPLMTTVGTVTLPAFTHALVIDTMLDL